MRLDRFGATALETILADKTVSMSEFKKNPAAVLREARNRPVAVLNHNRIAFYMLDPALMEAMIEALADQEIGNLRVRLKDRRAPAQVSAEPLAQED
jgi:antitoxin StbD